MRPGHWASWRIGGTSGAVILAFGLVACGATGRRLGLAPAPRFSPTPASSPDAPPADMTAMTMPTAEGAAPDEFVTATPFPSPTLISGSLPPAGPLHVGMSRDEAIRRTLGMLNPNGLPTIEDARLTTLGLLARLQAETGRTDLPPDPPRQPGVLVYVVVAQQAEDLLHGNNLSPGFHPWSITQLLSWRLPWTLARGP